jgi:hypothetical protein
VLSSYLLRPSATSAAVLQQHKAQHAWRSPVVGMHIRRTDKLAFEAAFHSVDEYMRQVQLQCDLALAPGWRAAAALQPQEPRPAGAAAHDWQRHEPRAAAATRDSSSSSSGGAGGVPNAFAASAGSASPAAPACSVYVATDEPTILQELRQGWPHIRVISNPVGTDTGVVVGFPVQRLRLVSLACNNGRHTRLSPPRVRLAGRPSPSQARCRHARPRGARRVCTTT